tara:strand:+ start:184 stop:573 length:390 start_codon:yes stop_codon:yes gene_type:complete
MNKIIVSTLIAIVASITMGCEVHNYPDGHTVVTPAGSTIPVYTSDPYEEPIVVVESSPTVVVYEVDPCDGVPYEVQREPFFHEPDWCFETAHGIQCEWYVGNTGPYGCWESWTFYDNECQWFYQFDYCG